MPTSPSSSRLPTPLSFTQCSVPRSLWLGCSSVAESLCALRCLQSIPSTRAHNQVLPLSSLILLTPSLPLSPDHCPTLHCATHTKFLMPPWCRLCTLSKHYHPFSVLSAPPKVQIH
uniref:Uncharacterized protein n=1 Tax=Periophthalmus magnuspinnatus TaxID=409849 RepID=A0A3B4BB25_9GOBI